MQTPIHATVSPLTFIDGQIHASGLALLMCLSRPEIRGNGLRLLILAMPAIQVCLAPSLHAHLNLRGGQGPGVDSAKCLLLYMRPDTRPAWRSMATTRKKAGPWPSTPPPRSKHTTPRTVIGKLVQARIHWCTDYSVPGTTHHAPSRSEGCIFCYESLSHNNTHTHA